MAKPIELQAGFTRMVQDLPRYSLPKDACWNMVDWLPEHQASARKRGGWDWAVSALSGTRVSGLGVADFHNGEVLCAVTQSRKFYSIAVTATASSAVATSASGTPPWQVAPWATHKDTLIMTGTDTTGAFTGAYAFDGATVSAISDTFGTINPTCVTVYKDRTVLNGGTGSTNVYFSAANDPMTYDTTTSWITTSAEVIGLASLPNSLIIFHREWTGRIRGSTPPPGTDMTLEDPIFNLGCIDARSIAVHGGYAIFANMGGVYRTNGSILPEDLTKTAGLKVYWNTVTTGFKKFNWVLSGGVYKDKYYVAITDTNGVFVDAFVFDLVTRTGYRLSNLYASAFATSTAQHEELFFGATLASRVARLSTIWTPVASFKNDGDGTAVAPQLETPFYLDPRSGKKTWRSLYVEYDMRDAASDNPILTVSTCRTPDGSYTALSPTLPETTDHDYVRRNLRFPADGIGLKIQQTNASSETKLVALLADVHTREGSRLN